MSNLNDSVTVPPPPWGSGGKDSGTQPGLILRIEGAQVDISHTYRNATSPEVNCLIVIQVRKKGNMSVHWADEAYQDSRIDCVNKKIADNTVIIISALEVKLYNPAMKEGSEAFWSSNGMTKQTPQPNAPESEYWKSNIDGVKCEIKLLDGCIKIVDLK